MGGMDEPDGIKEIVKKVISTEEFQSISRDDNGKALIKYVVPNSVKSPHMWGATVSYMIFSGPDRRSAVKARRNSKNTWWEELSIWFDIDESPAMPPSWRLLQSEY